MVTKEFARQMPDEEKIKYVNELFDKTRDDRDWMQKEQVRIKRHPEQYEDKINEIRSRISETRSDLVIFRDLKLDKPMVLYAKIDNIRSMIAHIENMINVCFFKYESKVSPIRRFKEEAYAYTSGEGELYSSLMIIHEFYINLEDTQKSVSALCKRARKNEDNDLWYAEMNDLKNVIEHIISALDETGKYVIGNEALSHTIYEVLIYEHQILKCKMNRYLIPYKLRYLS